MPGDFVGQSQKLGVPFDQESPRALVAAIFGGLFANAGALVVGNRVKAILALFAATEHPGAMGLAGGAAAVGFAAFAAQQIEGALNHGVGALKDLDGKSHGREGAAELLTEFGSVAAQSVSLINTSYTDSKRKMSRRHKKPSRDSGEAKLNVFTKNYGLLPTV